LESLARLTCAEREAKKSRGLSPIQTVQALTERGYIENDAADRLHEMAKVRDAVVHGDFSVVALVERIEGKLAQLRRIASDIASVTEANAG
jgi:uncharacterized protein YutE (UPF0331/DUF86 family)